MMRLATLALLVAGTAAAQVHETVTVNVVEVPVTVVDAGGDPVRGLTAANFEIFDDGKKRAVTSLDVIDLAARDAGAISPMNPHARRSFLLLFDLGFSAPASLARAQDAARRFLTDGVQPRDLVAVGTIEVDKGFHLLAGFTTDRELLAAAIGDPRGFVGSDPLQIANQALTFTGGADPGVARPSPPGGQVRSERNDVGPKEMAEMARLHEQEISQIMKQRGDRANRHRVEQEVDALGQLARELRAVPGRKQVILLSEGFDAKHLQGRDVRDGDEATKDNESVVHGEVWRVDNDVRYGSSGSLTVLDRMTRYFRTSDVVLHAIDIQGVRVQNDVAEGARINSNAGLFLVSRPTGGEVFQNDNNLKTAFARMLHQQEVVYVLGFQAPATKPGTFHDLRVKVVNAPHASVAHRAGYFESGGEVIGDRSMANAEIIVNDLPQREIGLAAFAAPLPADGGQAQVSLILELDGADLLKAAGGGDIAVEVYVYAFDHDGVVRDRLFEKMRLDLAKVAERLRITGVKYFANLRLPPGHFAVKALVRVPNGDRRGFARADVVVPRPGEVEVVSFFIEEQPREWVMVRGLTEAGTAYPFHVNGEPFVPSASARVRNAEHRHFAVFVTNADAEAISVTATVHGMTGKPRRDPMLIHRVQGDGFAKAIFDWDAAGIDGGSGKMDIVVKESVSQTRTVSLPFVVQ